MLYPRRPVIGLLLACLLVLGTATDVFAQWSRSGDRSSRYEFNDNNVIAPRRMIDAPTAGVLPRGSFDTELRSIPDGGLLAILQIGLTSRWQIGISYGGSEVISSSDPEWNPRMQFLTKIQIINESFAFPGVAIGFEEQGFGLWIDSLSRYQIKSKGFYAVASKGYRSANFTSSLHGGVNLSREDADDDNLNFFLGADMSFDNNLGLVAEYDLALNDDRKPDALGRGRGYLNAGIRWIVMEKIQIEGALKDLLENRRDTDTFGRELRLIYVERF
ncbi:MAG: hypothetical protein Kow0074_00440 [Candidatus Zixiibacteriota bacterium]